MSRNKLKSRLENLDDIYFLPLLSSAAALKLHGRFRNILVFLKDIKYSKVEIYEALLQLYLFTGFPNALVSLKIANEYFNFGNNKVYTDDNIDFKVVGEKYCKRIYGEKYPKLINNVESFSSELSRWLVSEGYGKVLSRKQLSLKKRELSIISVLCCLKFDSQLFSHINGAYRLGVSIKVIENVIKNLGLLGKNSYRDFGLKALKRYKDQKEIS